MIPLSRFKQRLARVKQRRSNFTQCFSILKQRRSYFIVTTACFAATVSACASDAELDTLAPQGPVAETLHSRAVVPVFAIAGVVFFCVMIGMAWLIWRFHVKDYTENTEWPKQTHGNTKLEIGWTAGFFAVMSIVAGLMLWSLADINSTSANPTTIEVDDKTVQWEPTVVVVGNQWWWEFRYYFNNQVDLARLRELGDSKNLPDADIVTSGQMVIPIGEEIELIITSRDVIHSFWIPALNGKRDAVPNRFSPWKIEASEQGVYFGQCTEFCGLSHSRMRMQVVAVNPTDFQKWVNDTTADANEPADSHESALRGRDTFAGLCTSCHLVEGLNDDTYTVADQASQAAPNLTHFASRTTYAGGIFNTYLPDGSLNKIELKEWLRNPADLKANYTVTGEQYRGMPDLDLNEQQINDLVEYLSILGNNPAQWIIQETEVQDTQDTTEIQNASEMHSHSGEEHSVERHSSGEH